MIIIRIIHNESNLGVPDVPGVVTDGAPCTVEQDLHSPLTLIISSHYSQVSLWGRRHIIWRTQQALINMYGLTTTNYCRKCSFSSYITYVANSIQEAMWKIFLHTRM